MCLPACPTTFACHHRLAEHSSSQHVLAFRRTHKERRTLRGNVGSTSELRGEEISGSRTPGHVVLRRCSAATPRKLSQDDDGRRGPLCPILRAGGGWGCWNGEDLCLSSGVLGKSVNPITHQGIYCCGRSTLAQSVSQSHTIRLFPNQQRSSSSSRYICCTAVFPSSAVDASGIQCTTFPENAIP